jgi:histone acetyltransferase (RNA polymerase elongator complex component)
MKKKKKLIVPIFIPHEGCPYRCVFCSQVDLTGTRYIADEQLILDTLKTYLGPDLNSTQISNCEVAFYGGSFTGLPRVRQKSLLSVIRPFLDSGLVSAIRVSTHPLFIDSERLDVIKAYGVKTVELGVQSTSEQVLEESGRPCSKVDLLNSISLIKERDFSLGLQLMMGLPGDNEKRFQRSVLDVISMKPDFVRLYPTLVLRHTSLYLMYKKGLYSPWTLNRTLVELKRAMILFKQFNIPVIRVGVQPDPSLVENLVAGPFHPSLRYLVECQMGLDLMVEKILSLKSLPQKISFKVPKNFISIYTGNKRENIRYIKNRFGFKEVSLKGEELCSEVELVA